MPAFSGMYDDVQGAPYSLLWAPAGTASGSKFNHTGAGDRINIVLRNGQGHKTLKAVMRALIGATAGGSATATESRVQADQQPGEATACGGKRTIETKTYISRVTTAGDVTNIQEIFDRVPNNASTYPVDRSGNGGGGKAAVMF